MKTCTYCAIISPTKIGGMQVDKLTDKHSSSGVDDTTKLYTQFRYCIKIYQQIKLYQNGNQEIYFARALSAMRKHGGKGP